MSSVLFNALKGVPDYDFPYLQNDEGEYVGEFMESFDEKDEEEILKVVTEFYTSVNVPHHSGVVTGIFARLDSTKEGINKSLSLLVEACLSEWFLSDAKAASDYLEDKVLWFLHQYRYRKIELIQNFKKSKGVASSSNKRSSTPRSYSLMISKTKKKMTSFSIGMPNEIGTVKEHDRRGHWRQLQSGSITFVRECTINKGQGSSDLKKQKYISEI
jgi:hypothetical protein